MKYFTLLLVAAISLAACSTTGPDETVNARNRTANKVLAGAAKILGQLAVNTLLDTTQSEIKTTSDKNMASSAAQGVWSQAANWATGKAIELAVNAFSARELPKTAKMASAAFNASPAPPAQKANAIAAVISTAAGAPPPKL